MDVSLIIGSHDNSIQTKEKHGNACDGKTEQENENRNVIFYGPWGGCGGNAWNDGCWYTGVREIIIMSGDTIDSMRVIYDMHGIPVPSQKHGGDGGSCKTVMLNWPCEYLLAISGYYAPMGCHVVVRSLTFITNKRKYGPFGVETGTPFSSPINPGRKIVGFKGRSGSYLDQIGVYVA